MDPCSDRSLNWLVDPSIDRLPHRRGDAAWIADRLADPTTRLIPIWRSRSLFAGDDAVQLVTLAPQGPGGGLIDGAESVTLLGRAEGAVYFALGFSPDEEAPSTLQPDEGALRHLRAVAPLLSRNAGALLAYANAMAHWHHHHRFCGRCGNPTTSTDGGHLLVCTNAACAEHHFPRMDPAIIVLVACGERCLLGRQPTWSPTIYSTIAGFVEPGESLEGAVAREVEEETGVRVRSVRYHSSQPWPFPSSLMLGFTAEASETTIHLNDGELEDARWFSRGEIEDSLGRGDLRLPSPVSISYRLIADWFDSEETTLSDLISN